MAAWTVVLARTSRRHDLDTMLTVLGLASLKTRALWRCRSGAARRAGRAGALSVLVNELAGYIRRRTSRLTRASVEIYQRYHELLGPWRRRQPLPAWLNPPTGGVLIQPMPGMGEFLALITGLLGAEACAWRRVCAMRWTQAGLPPTRPTKRCANLGAFREAPAKVALVTSSIAYEAALCCMKYFDSSIPTARRGLSDNATARVRGGWNPRAFTTRL